MAGSVLARWVCFFFLLVLISGAFCFPTTTSETTVKVLRSFRTALCEHLCSMNPPEGGNFCNCDKHPLG